jgi:tetratricopeptide (TPR) repeat protein
VFNRDGMEQSITAFPNLLVAMAWAQLETGHAAEAEALLVTGHSRALAINDRPGLIEVLWVKGMVAARQARWDDAEELLQNAVALARDMPFPFAEGRALWAWGMMYARKGDAPRARQHLEEALAVFRWLGDRLHAGPTEIALRELEQSVESAK